MWPVKNQYDQLVFSCLSGYNYYQIANGGSSAGNSNIRAVHMLNGTEVEIRPNDTLSKEVCSKKWYYFIEFPADIRNILWPVDIVLLSQDEKHFGLVFRRRAFPKLEPFREILYNEELLDWRKNNIQYLSVNFLDVCESLHSAGYAYHCFDLNRMYYNPKNMSVRFDFSLSLSRTHGELYKTETIQKDDVAIEMLPPWHKPFESHDMSLADDYYSITAMLFRLMIGRMPYQGRMMDGAGDMMNALRDTDELNHSIMFEQYLSQPIFIFDPDNNINMIGLLTNEQIFIDRWNTLPAKVQDMFLKVLCQKNVELDPDRRICYSPQQWRDVLGQECFNATSAKGDEQASD